MNTAEFTTWAMTLKTFYPKENLLPDKEAMQLWYELLHDLDYKTAIAMLQKWVSTEKWPPSIAEVRAMCAEIDHGKLPEWSDAWKEVTRAIARHGYAHEEEALDSMSPLTQKVVCNIGWRAICLSENADVIRAQFRQVFQICANREVQDRQMTPELKAMINSLLEEHSVLAQLPEASDG